MSKEYIPVKTYLVREKTEGGSTYTYLVIEEPDGTRSEINVLNGGGYVTQLSIDKEEQN